MKIVRILIYVPACVVFLITVGVYLEYIYWAGFPDGFMSEKERAEKMLSTFFCWISIFFGFYFFRLAWISPKKNNSRKIVFWSYVYLVIILITYLVKVFLFAGLMDSRGG